MSTFSLPSAAQVLEAGRKSMPALWRGVNLGNWLVLERWMQPGLFAPYDVADEYSLCAALGASAERVMRRHRETFIRAEDFAWIRERGLNAVRIPVGYWLFEDDPPFVAQPEMLDQAIAWCDAYGLAANIDLHGLPGFQSNEHHSGRRDHWRWPDDPDCLHRSLDFVEQIAQRYRDHPAVAAISVVNEPSPDIPAEALRTFYAQACERIRRYMSAEDVAVIIAAFTEARLPELHRCLRGERNVLTDIHPYPCFVHWDQRRLADYARWGIEQHAPHVSGVGGDDLVIGEWSLGIARELRPQVAAMTDVDRNRFMRRFADGQLASFNQTAGWFFWSYKVLVDDALLRRCWSFRDATEMGWLPQTWTSPG